MKKASFVVAKPYMNNEIFREDSPLNMNDLLLCYRELKASLREIGYNLSTSDLIRPEEADLVIYNEMPKILPSPASKARSYLLLFESEIIRADNWQLHRHEAFGRIFTWHENFAGKGPYVKYNFPVPLPPKTPRHHFQSRKLATLIAGAKICFHPLSLYDERVKTIYWFEKHRPKDFEFYGGGWNRMQIMGGRWISQLNRIPGLGRALARNHPSYRGPVDDKAAAYAKYRFSICYENGFGIPGYITEKILDCFVAGIVPVYWGAPDIEKHIPADCWIRREDFRSHEELYSFLSSMTEAKYASYLDAIDRFLSSPAARAFSPKTFAETIQRQILQDFG